MTSGQTTHDNGPQASLNQAIRACHQMASILDTSYSDSEITPIIEAVQQEQKFTSLRDVKVAIVDDSREILRMAIPVLVAATHGNATFIYVDPSKDFTATEIVETIASSGAQWVVLDAQLGQDFDGPELAQLLREKYPQIQCIGFSSMPSFFHGTPVRSSVMKQYAHVGDIYDSIKQCAEVVAGVEPLAKPEMLIAISVLCQAVMLASGREEDLILLGATPEMLTRLSPQKAQERLCDASMWRETLATGDGDLLSKVAKEFCDLRRAPALHQLVVGLADGSLQQVTPEVASKVYQEIAERLSR